MEGKRKFILCSASVGIASLLCAFGKVTGEQATSILTVTMMVFGGGNVAEHISKAWGQRG